MRCVLGVRYEVVMLCQCCVVRLSLTRKQCRRRVNLAFACQAIRHYQLSMLEAVEYSVWPADDERWSILGS